MFSDDLIEATFVASDGGILHCIVELSELGATILLMLVSKNVAVHVPSPTEPGQWIGAVSCVSCRPRRRFLTNFSQTFGSS